MKILYVAVFVFSAFFNVVRVHAADRYWIHKTVYQSFFSSAMEISDWQLIEDNGAGGFTASGNGTGILTMDNAAGGYANRLFSVIGGSARLLPFDQANGRAELFVKSITGGNQRIFLQAQEFDGLSNYLGQVNILPAQSAIGFFSVDLSTVAWDPATVQIRFIIGGENYSGQQGTAEFGFFSYSNTNNNWSNPANWSSTSGGPGGTAAPGPSDNAIFDGAGASNGSCLLDVSGSINAMQLTSNYAGNIDLQNNAMIIGSGGVSIGGGGITGDLQDIQVNGNITITGGAFKNSSGSLYVRGDVAISGGTLDFSLGTVVFDGSSDQQFISSVVTPVNNWVVNKPSGVINLNSDILISGLLSLTNGVLNTGAHTIYLGTGGGQTGNLNMGSGLINGNFTRWMGPASSGIIAFPLGSGAAAAPLSLTIVNPPSVAGTITAYYTDAAPGSTPVNFQDNTTTIWQRYAASWSIQTNNLNDGNYNLSLSNDHMPSISNLSDLHLTLAAGVAGLHQAATGSLSNPTVNRTNLNASELGQIFYISSAGAVLPVTWVDFGVDRQDENYFWDWTVGEEQNIAYYLPQYGTDGINFVSAGKVEVFAGNRHYSFSSPLQLYGPIFFRVQEIDLDGKSTYSAVRELKASDDRKFSVYPNPALDIVHIHWPDPGAVQITTFVYDIKGAIIRSQTNPYQPDFNLILFGLAPGTYGVGCRDNNFHQSPVYKILKK